ncbi:sulfotransferase domain-containing protein [Thioclava sp. JE_KL1]|nr:sulfotransferase domain-containing protein [Thioclava sp. JE_KL1]
MQGSERSTRGAFLTVKFPAKIGRKLSRISNRFAPGQSPGFLIIGAQKAGTTTLFNLLNEHPQLQGSEIKEIGHFSQDIDLGATQKDYENNFRSMSLRRRIFYEATPAYLARPGVAAKIHDYYPSMKMICLLREPVSRAFSAYNMYARMLSNGYLERIWKAKGRPANNRIDALRNSQGKTASFRNALELELDMMNLPSPPVEPSLIRRGFYLEQLEPFWKQFGEDNILIIGFSDLKKQKGAVLKNITNFLEIESFKNTPELPWHNRGEYPETIKTSDREFLEEIYREPNERLFEKIGKINW